MRKFSEFEKNVLRFFVSGQSRSLNYILINMYGDLFNQRKVVYDLNNPNQLTFYREQQDLSMDEMLQTERMIIDISFLIEYIKRENLIHSFLQGNGLTSIGNAQSGANWRAISIALDPTVSTILQDAMNQCVIASQDLIDLVDRNFHTAEDVNLILTKKALAVSINSYRIALCALFSHHHPTHCCHRHSCHHQWLSISDVDRNNSFTSKSSRHSTSDDQTTRPRLNCCFHCQ